jgi:hypothetical protein
MKGSGIPDKKITLEGIPGIPLEFSEVLKTRHLTDTRSFFEATKTLPQQDELARSTGIPRERIREIRSLCDLCRVSGISGIRARALYHAGIRTQEALAAQDSGSLWKDLTSGEGPYHHAFFSLKLAEAEQWVAEARSMAASEERPEDTT